MDLENTRGEEDIAIYIDELKCDDPNLKLSAVSKIVDIAKILGNPRFMKVRPEQGKNLSHI